MKKEKLRHCLWLALLFLAVGAVLCIFEQTRSSSFAFFVLAVIWPLLWVLRQKTTTPESREAQEKKERIQDDERNQAIAGRAYGVSFLVVGLLLIAGAVVAAALGLKILLYYSLGLLAILFVSFFIARAVYSHRM